MMSVGTFKAGENLNLNLCSVQWLQKRKALLMAQQISNVNFMHSVHVQNWLTAIKMALNER